MNAVIVDYGMCNMDSIRRAIEECGGKARISDDPSDLKMATHIILPGVGSFASAMKNLEKRGFVGPLREQALKLRIPVLGICLGMQLLAERGFEGSETSGLGLIPGEVVPLIPDDPGVRIPHVGWNSVYFQQACALFEGMETGRDFYFVHSYHLACADKGNVLATTPYCGQFASVVGCGSVFGTQFHPEKSQWLGFALLKNFLMMAALHA
jgi:glutamine amidotransferase